VCFISDKDRRALFPSTLLMPVTKSTNAGCWFLSSPHDVAALVTQVILSVREMSREILPYIKAGMSDRDPFMRLVRVYEPTFSLGDVLWPPLVWDYIDTTKPYSVTEYRPNEHGMYVTAGQGIGDRDQARRGIRGCCQCHGLVSKITAMSAGWSLKWIFWFMLRNLGHQFRIPAVEPRP
jgi:hypothetical protein